MNLGANEPICQSENEDDATVLRTWLANTYNLKIDTSA